MSKNSIDNRITEDTSSEREKSRQAVQALMLNPEVANRGDYKFEVICYIHPRVQDRVLLKRLSAY